ASASITTLSSFFFSSRRRHTRFSRDWSSDVCSSDLQQQQTAASMSQFEQQLSALEGRIAQQVNQSTAALEQAVRNQLRQQQQQLDNYHMTVKSVQAELANLDLSQEAHWRIFEARNLTDRAAMKLWIE